MQRVEQKITVQSNFSEDQEEIEVLQFPDGVSPARAVLGFGQTVNTGSYSSMRYNVRIEIPCYQEEIDEAFNYARAVLEQRAAEMRASIKEATGK